MTDQQMLIEATEALKDCTQVTAAPEGHPTAIERPIVAMHENVQDWFHGTREELKALAQLPQNWDSYGAGPVDRRSISWAIAYLEALAFVVGVNSPSVGAGADGLVGLSWDVGKWSLDVTVRPDGFVDYVYIDELNSQNDRDECARGPEALVRILTDWD